MAAYITFIGGEETGDVGSTTFEDTLHGFNIVFPLNKPVLVDPSSATGSQNGTFLEHVIRKARTNRFFEVVDATTKDLIREKAPAIEYREDVAEDFDDDKEALIKEAESLGVDVDRRWGVKRLESAISEAKIKKLDE